MPLLVGFGFVFFFFFLILLVIRTSGYSNLNLFALSAKPNFIQLQEQSVGLIDPLIRCNYSY